MALSSRMAVLISGAAMAACGGEENAPVQVQHDPLEVSARPPGFTFDQMTEVELLTSRPAHIFYTLDGTDPEPGGDSSIEYDGAIPLERSTLVSFIAVAEDGTWSIPQKELYVPAQQALEQKLLPRSLTTDRESFFFSPPPGQSDAETTFRLRSTGIQRVRISAIDIGLNPKGWGFFEDGVFELVAPPEVPLDLQPGAELTLTVHYHVAATLRSAAIFVQSDEQRRVDGTVVLELWGRALGD